jgi:cytochrome c oxidase subunit 3
MSASRSNAPYYFVPGPSRWPVLAGVSLLLTMIGASAWVNHVSWGSYVNIAGVILTVIVMYNWFGDAISNLNPASTAHVLMCLIAGA